jgi:hypothetical protein
MHFWAAVSAIAGSLRRRVWIDMIRFKWFPSFYTVFVADPGIVAKSSTADIAMELLRQVPGIHFGPDNATWQSLVSSFAGARETFQCNVDAYVMSAITLLASEYGNLMDMEDQNLINLFITLWDGRDRYDKHTKKSGSDSIECPWINLLACTTPSWIATNMTKLALAGGLTSRTLFVFSDQKASLVAYPDEAAPDRVNQLRDDLISDLTHFAENLVGPMSITAEARKWGARWYEKLWKNAYKPTLPDWQKGYLSRKQAHLHKLAMVISVSRSDSMQITADDLELAEAMLLSVESDMEKVFSRMENSSAAADSTRFIEFIRRQQVCQYEEAFRLIHSSFPGFRNFEGIVAGAIKNGLVMVTTEDGKHMLRYAGR